MIILLFLGTAFGQKLSCTDGVIPPELVTMSANGPTLRSDVFLLYEPPGCEAVMPLLIRVENRLPGTCLVPHWAGVAGTTLVVSDLDGKPVPTIIRDASGQEQSCIPYGMSAWSMAPSRQARISADVYANVRPGTLPGLHDRLDGGYPALNAGLTVALPNGAKVAFPSPMTATCPAEVTVMVNNFAQTRDFVWFNATRCQSI